MFKKVMVVIDAEAKHEQALDKALRLARVDDFELILFSSDHSQYLVEGYYFDAVEVKRLRAEYIAERLEALEEIAEPLRANGLSVQTIAEWAYPSYEGVVVKAESLGVDLIVHHVGRHGAISRMLLTHDDWQLIRESKAPLLLVKDHNWGDPLKIMAAVDPQHARHKPSGLDHKILAHGQALSDLMGGELYAVHAYRSLPHTGDYPLETQKIHKAAFDGLMGDFDLPADHQLLIEEAPILGLQEAEKQIDADVVVMGAVSRSYLKDVIIGNTTEQVVDYLGCDVLVLKPDDLLASA